MSMEAAIQLVPFLEIGDENSQCIALHARNSTLALGNANGTVEVYDLKCGRAVGSFAVFDAAPIIALAWLGNDRLVVAVEGRSPCVLTVATGTVCAVPNVQDPCESLHAAVDAPVVAGVSARGTVNVIGVDAASSAPTVLWTSPPGAAPASAAALSPAGDTLYIGAVDGTLAGFRYRDSAASFVSARLSPSRVDALFVAASAGHVFAAVGGNLAVCCAASLGLLTTLSDPVGDASLAHTAMLGPWIAGAESRGGRLFLWGGGGRMEAVVQCVPASDGVAAMATDADRALVVLLGQRSGVRVMGKSPPASWLPFAPQHREIGDNVPFDEPEDAFDSVPDKTSGAAGTSGVAAARETARRAAVDAARLREHVDVFGDGNGGGE